jgi:hypothetical protein
MSEDQHINIRGNEKRKFMASGLCRLKENVDPAKGSQLDVNCRMLTGAVYVGLLDGLLGDAGGCWDDY